MENTNKTTNDIIKIGSGVESLKEFKGLRLETTSIKKVLFLTDVSSSMDGEMADGRTKLAHLHDALKKLGVTEKQCISFGSKVYPYELSDMGMGSTVMNEAFTYVIEHQIQFDKLCVISDGAPDSRHDTLREAKRLGREVNVLYIGEAGTDGERFMEELARVTKGKTVTTEATSELLMAGIKGLIGDGSISL